MQALTLNRMKVMNKRVKHSIILLWMGCLLTISGYTQNVYPEIGKPMQEFDLKKIKDYPNRVLSSGNLKGKHYILDFWSEGCGACITAFPKMNALQKKYRDHLEVFLVTGESKWRNIEAFYNVYKKKYNLELPCAIDSSFFNSIVPRSVPHIIWVDDMGIIKAITSTTDVHEKNIERFLSNQSFDFIDCSYTAIQLEEKENKADFSTHISDIDNTKTNFLYHSWLQKWKPGMGKDYPRSVESYIAQYKKPQFRAVKLTLNQLYSVAYFGEHYSTSGMSRDTSTYYQPLIETKDSILFSHQYPGQPYHNYFVELPGEPANANRLRRIMQTDLKNYFGYDAKMVYRDLPCVRLVVIDKERAEKLKAIPGGKPSNQWQDESTNNFFRNQPLTEIIRVLVYKIDGINSQLAFDNTGITGPVNLDIKAHIWDYEGIRKSLQEQGLDLIKSTKRMRVLEINDPVPEVGSIQNDDGISLKLN